ncbi:hypothetical protein Tco_1482151 [Tanacetum coccineum]
MAFNSPFGLATVLLGRDPVPDEEASAFGFFWAVGGWSKRDLLADFSRLMLASFWSFARSVIVAWVDGGVPDVDRYMLAVLGEGGLGSAVVATPEPSFFVGCGSEGRRGIVEMIVSAMVSNTSGECLPELANIRDNENVYQNEVGEDIDRVREYRGVIFGLKIDMRRREECIGELKALGDCECVIETVRFMEGGRSVTVRCC